MLLTGKSFQDSPEGWLSSISMGPRARYDSRPWCKRVKGPFPPVIRTLATSTALRSSAEYETVSVKDDASLGLRDLSLLLLPKPRNVNGVARKAGSTHASVDALR